MPVRQTGGWSAWRQRFDDVLLFLLLLRRQHGGGRTGDPDGQGQRRERATGASRHHHVASHRMRALEGAPVTATVRASRELRVGLSILQLADLSKEAVGELEG